MRIQAVLTLMALSSACPPLVAAQSSGTWWPASGSVILAGGGLQSETADRFADRLIALAGGPDAIIVIIPTASDGLPQLPGPGPEPARIRDLRRHFESRGARHVLFLNTRDRRVANSEAFVQVLRTANAVFFPGGRARILDETYHGTLLERELKALLQRGGVLAGDSAGAITLGCDWLDWHGPTSPFAPVSHGLCVLPRVAVTPHIRPTDGRAGEDERTDTILAYVAAHPQTIAINIEQNTVLVLRGDTAEVIGQGGATVFDASKNRTGPALRLARGAIRSVAHP